VTGAITAVGTGSKCKGFWLTNGGGLRAGTIKFINKKMYACIQNNLKTFLQQERSTFGFRGASL
jgi:hypothetical protein